MVQQVNGRPGARGGSGTRRAAAAGVLAALVALAGAVLPAQAQTGGDGSGASTTTTTTPAPGATTSTTVEDLGADEDIAPVEAPEDVEVPTSSAGQSSRAIVGDLDSARERLADAEAALADAEGRVADLDAEITALDAHLAELEVRQRQAVRRLDEARRLLAQRAVDAYVRGNNPGLDAILRAEDPSELEANSSFLATVLDADAAAVQGYLEARAALTVDLVESADARFTARSELQRAETSARELAADVADREVEVAAFEAGSEIFISGFTFPVGDPHEFTSTFGAPRVGHSHQGNDIFAPTGTDLYACERGVITRMGTDTLGGTKLWIVGESGTHYYYAHLSAYADGLRNGQVVEAGELVGYVGNTGNARTTPPHLHFEIHPDGGPAIDPYPLLSTVDALDGGLPAGQVDVADA